MQILTERSPDHKFTQTYSQPADYHFCWDSVIFARFVADRLADRPVERLLDVCAGCGIIGLEMAHHHRALKQADFLEVQETYRPHFEENSHRLGRSEFRFLNLNYNVLREVSFADKYDVIVCNPPYFFADEGKLSPNELRTRSRFFVDSTFENLVLGLSNALRPGGEAFLLTKPGARHGRDPIGTMRELLPDDAVKAIADIRGTLVIQILKNSQE